MPDYNDTADALSNRETERADTTSDTSSGDAEEGESVPKGENSIWDKDRSTWMTVLGIAPMGFKRVPAADTYKLTYQLCQPPCLSFRRTILKDPLMCTFREGNYERVLVRERGNIEIGYLSTVGEVLVSRIDESKFHPHDARTNIANGYQVSDKYSWRAFACTPIDAQSALWDETLQRTSSDLRLVWHE